MDIPKRRLGRLEERGGRKRFRPMTREEEDELVASANPYARELMYYKP